MNIYSYNPVEVFFGENCIADHPEVFRRYGRHALIVTGRSSAKNGSLADVTAALTSGGISWDIFDGTRPNPTVASVREGAALARSCGADLIIGIGGGSPMDTAKGIALLAVQDLPGRDLFTPAKYGDRILPMIMVPTTAGTGSEVSEYSVLMDEEEQTKYSITTPLIYPKAAFLDWRYTRGIGRDVTLYPALDALSHAIEGVLSQRGDAMITPLALESILVIGRSLTELRAFCGGRQPELSDTCREQLLLGAYLGGLTLAHTSTTVVHAIGHSLTFSRDIVHGRANALVLPAYMEFIAKSRPDAVGRVLDAMNLSSTAEFRAIFDELLCETDVLTEEEIHAFTDTVMKKKNVPNCLVIPDREDVMDMLRHLAGRRTDS